MKTSLTLLFLSSFILAACQTWIGDRDRMTATPTSVDPLLIQKTQSEALDISLEAFLYLEEALKFIQENFIRRDQIDWDAYRKEVFQLARGSRTPRDVYPAIEFAIGELHDRHSQFARPEQILPDVSIPEIKVELVEGRIGYITVPAHPSSSPEKFSEYATTMQKEIREIDQNSPCGWIVDLRNNTGGSMMGMLAGVGPILGEGESGAFVGPDGSKTPWVYEDGALSFETEGELDQYTYVSDAYQLQEPNPNVAILTNLMTASSGEVIVVAFKGRPGTRFFGEPTNGLTTGVQGHIFKDGAAIGITTSYFADRTGKIYNDSIRPDEFIFDMRDWGVGDPDQDPVISGAVDWLLNQEACK